MGCGIGSTTFPPCPRPCGEGSCPPGQLARVDRRLTGGRVATPTPICPLGVCLRGSEVLRQERGPEDAGAPPRFPWVTAVTYEPRDAQELRLAGEVNALCDLLPVQTTRLSSAGDLQIAGHVKSSSPVLVTGWCPRQHVPGAWGRSDR